MDKTTPRRSFLKNTLKASTGLALISSTAPFSAFATYQSPFEGYNPFAEEKTDLRRSLFGRNVLVAGKIFDEDGNNTLTNVKVEVWHLSPDSSKYKHRAKLFTNYLGEYRFITDYPNREKGKMARILFKVSNGSKATYTELLFNEHQAHITGAHWENNQGLGDERLFPIMERTTNTTKINFNITL